MEVLEMLNLVNFIVANGDLDKYDVTIKIAPKGTPAKNVIEEIGDQPNYVIRKPIEEEVIITKKEEVVSYKPETEMISGDYALTVSEFREKLKELYPLRHYNFAFLKLDEERQNIIGIQLLKSDLVAPKDALELPFVTEECYGPHQRYLKFIGNPRDFKEYDRYLEENLPKTLIKPSNLSPLFTNVQEYKYLQIQPETYHMKKVLALKVDLTSPIALKKSSLLKLSDEFRKIVL